MYKNKIFFSGRLLYHYSLWQTNRLLVKKLFPSILWNKSRKEKTIYLTFDDGPIPEVTPWVLDVLSEYNAKATFFCIGENVTKHSDIFNRIIAEGHSIGNHTFNHISGYKTLNDIYLRNIEECNKIVKSSLFRPPHGQISFKQIKLLKGSYTIVIWDVLTGDFDTNLSPEKCLSNAIKNAKNGSIVLFHDNIEARKNLHYALPKALEYWKAQGYSFRGL